MGIVFLRWICVCTWTAVALAATQSSGDSTGSVDLRILPAAGEPVLVELRLTTEGSGFVRIGDEETEIPLTDRIEVDFVDQFTELGDDSWTAERRYARYHHDGDDGPEDPGLDGATVRFASRDGKHRAELTEDRLTSGDTAQGLLRQAPSVGPWIALPREANVGDTFDVEMTATLALLTLADGDITVESARFELDSFDAATKRATLTGRLRWQERLEEGDIEIIGTVDGTATLVIDTRITGSCPQSSEAKAKPRGKVRV